MQNQKITDHLGNQFRSITKLCEFWNISRKTFMRYMNKHQDVKTVIELLTDESYSTRCKQCEDHLGNTFESITDLCAHYNITPHAYKDRFCKRKWTLEQTLTTPMFVKSKRVCDHLGNEFPSKNAMYRYYGITATQYKNRIKSGLPIEQALFANENKRNLPCKDHHGTEFESITDMCNHYGISMTTYLNRVKKLGWNVEKALTQETMVKQKFDRVEDTLGNEFNTITDMCKYYEIRPSNYYNRLEKNYDIIEALLIVPRISNRMKNTLVAEFIFVEHCIENDYYLCKVYENEIILNRNQILNLARKHLSEHHNAVL